VTRPRAAELVNSGPTSHIAREFIRAGEVDPRGDRGIVERRSTVTDLAAHDADSPRTPAPARQRRGGYWWYLVPGAIGFVAVILGPLVYNVYLSLTKWSGVGSPRFIGLTNYIRLMGDSVFWTSFKNSVAMIIAMVVIPTLIGLILASVLFDYLGKRFGAASISVLRAVFYLPQVLPVVVAGIVWGWILRPDGAFNAILDAVGLSGFTRDWLGDPNTALPMVMLVMVWVQIGYPVVIFMSALGRVDPEIYEAAEIDGAGYWARFTAITLPQIRPETFVVALTCTIAALKVFGPIYALTRGGPENATNVPSYFAYYTFFKKLDVGYGAAIATVLTIIIVLVAVGIMRWQAHSEKKELSA
jgi:raffinose/stachyose/melibiose transport system permease protein